MKFKLVGQTTYAWSELLAELPAEHTAALNKARVNIQSAYGLIQLLARFDCERMKLGNANGDVCTLQPYILNFWTFTFWFELPYEIIDELRAKVNLNVISVSTSSKSVINKGLVTGTLKDWAELCSMEGTPYVSSDLNKLILVVRGFFDSQSLNFLLPSD